MLRDIAKTGLEGELGIILTISYHRAKEERRETIVSQRRQEPDVYEDRREEV